MRFFRWDVWAAAYLIADGCSDDSFGDFTAGLVGLGREWYEHVVADPDALADHPTVRAVAEGTASRESFFAEEFGFVASSALRQSAGDDQAYWEAHRTADHNPLDMARSSTSTILSRYGTVFPASPSCSSRKTGSDHRAHHRQSVIPLSEQHPGDQVKWGIAEQVMV